MQQAYGCAATAPYTPCMSARRRPKHPFLRHARRIRRRLVRRTVLATLAIVALVAVAVVWEGSLVRGVLERAFSKALGGPVAIARLSWTAPDALRLDGVTLDAPEWSGPGSRIASIARLEADLDVPSLIVGRIVFNSLVADGVELTIVEDPSKDGALNVAALKPSVDQGGGQSQPVEVVQAQVTELDVRRATVVHGELEIDQAQRFAGLLGPDAQRPGWTSFDLRVEGSQTALSGSVNQRSRALVANLQQLEALPTLRALLPASLRAILDLNPGGAISSASVQVAPRAGITAQVVLEQLTLDLPSAWVPEGWARFAGLKAMPTLATPTVTLERAELRFAGTTATVSNGRVRLAVADGSAAPLTLTFDGELTLPEDAATGGGSLSDALDRATFAIEAKLATVSYGKPGDPASLLLPMAAARLLGFFNLEQVDLGIDAVVARRDPDGEVTSDTTISVRNGVGAFHLFTYRLTDVEASIEVHADRADITYLRGTGAGGAPIQLSGSVFPLIDDPGVSLKLSTTGIVVDERFVSAFLPRPRRIFETLMDRRAWSQLAEAGLIDDGLGTCPPGLPRCVPGGRVSFDLSIDREPGTGKPEFITGRVNLHEVDLVLGFLPIPVRVREGAVQLGKDSVEFLGGGLAFEELSSIGQPAPARGLVSGSIAIPPGKDVPLRPDLKIVCTDLPITPLMLACLPHEDGARPSDWPRSERSVASRVLGQLGASGRVSIDGRVTPATAPTREVDFRFNVRLHDCTIDPSLGTGAEVIPWPRGFSLDRVTGALEGSHDGLRFLGIEARRGDARCLLHGNVGFDGALDLDAQGFGLELEPWLLDALDPTVRDGARTWWDRLKPIVRIDGGLVISGAVDSPTIAAWARPVQASIMADGARTTFTRMDGLAVWDRGVLTCTGLRGHNDEGWSSSCVDLSFEEGTIDATIAAEGLWSSAPAVREALSLVAPEALGVLAECGLEARCDLAARVRGPLGNLAIEASAHPDVGVVGSGDRSVPVAFDPGSRIRYADGRLSVDLDRARVPGGTIRVEAVIDPSSTDLIAQASCRAELGAWYAGLESVFGAAASSVLRAADAHWSEVGLADLEVISRPSPLQPSLIVRGTALMQDASFTGIVPIEGATGTATVLVESLPAGISVQLDASAPIITAIGRPLTNGTLSLVRPAGSERIELSRLGIGVGEGSASGSGWADPSGAWRLDATLAQGSVWAIGGDLPGSRPGVVDARIELDGTPGGRTGKGAFSASGLTLGDGSIGLGLLQLAQLSLPGFDRLERAKGDFTLNGDVATVTGLTVAGESLSLEGSGTVNLATSALDLQLSSRSGLPVLGQVLGALGDAFLRIRVTGTLSDPQPSLEPLVEPPAPPAVEPDQPSVGAADQP